MSLSDKQCYKWGSEYWRPEEGLINSISEFRESYREKMAQKLGRGGWDWGGEAISLMRNSYQGTDEKRVWHLGKQYWVWLVG